MGRRELLEALQREGQEAMAAIAARGAADEERLRAESAERIDALRREHLHLSELRCTELRRMVISTARSQAALIRLRAESILARRLHERAISSVRQLRTDNPDNLFHGLAAELPRAGWRTVRVNPDFLSLAAECFADAEIVADASLSGGLKVTSADGSLSVDNTLETRLERLWPELLPQLVAELRDSPA